MFLYYFAAGGKETSTNSLIKFGINSRINFIFFIMNIEEPEQQV